MRQSIRIINATTVDYPNRQQHHQQLEEASSDGKGIQRLESLSTSLVSRLQFATLGDATPPLQFGDDEGPVLPLQQKQQQQQQQPEKTSSAGEGVQRAASLSTSSLSRLQFATFGDTTPPLQFGEEQGPMSPPVSPLQQQHPLLQEDQGFVTASRSDRAALDLRESSDVSVSFLMGWLNFRACVRIVSHLRVFLPMVSSCFSRHNTPLRVIELAESSR